MLRFDANQKLKDFTTFKIGGVATYFTQISSVDEISEACSFAKEKNLPLFVLGGGSNIIVSDTDINAVVAKMELKGFERLEDTSEYAVFSIAAGENWDEIVGRTTALHLFGIEAMSAIPGTVGATPIQNVGAYGQEIKDVLQTVTAFDMQTNQFVTLTNQECGFSYRDSIFKNKEKGRYIITSITIKLFKKNQAVKYYPDVENYFSQHEITNPSSQDIRNAVIYIRSQKLPDPKHIPNCGSFFKNPIVETQIALKIKETNPTMPMFSVDEVTSKIPAGWLIEQSGLKGQTINSISVYKDNALVLVNNGSSSLKDVYEAREYIIDCVNKKFGVVLEQEPEMVG